MKHMRIAPIARMIAIALVLAAVAAWLQLQHLAAATHERALIALVLAGYLVFWLARGRRG